MADGRQAMGEDDGRPGHPFFAAVYQGLAPVLERGPIGAARRALLAGARGVVVDLGAGVGLNLPHLGDAVTHVHLIEPDPHMIRRLPSDLPGHVDVHQVGAERLPLDDAGVDTVLATLALCTVDDVGAALDEIHRVLRPGGQLLVLEHVRSLDPRFSRWQDRLQGPWSWFGAGCRVNRDTVSLLAAAGFDLSELERFGVPGAGLTREWVVGRVRSNTGPPDPR